MSSRLLAVFALVMFSSSIFVVPYSMAVIPTAGLTGASVAASGPSGSSATADSSGSYSMGDIFVAGSYNVSSSADGFITAYYPTLAAVTLGQVKGGVDFSLMRSSIVTGKVTGPGGVAVAGAVVTLTDNVTGDYVGSDVTTSDGVYAVQTDVPSGTYKIEVAPPSASGFLGITCSGIATICPDVPNYLPGFMSKTVVNVIVGSQVAVTKDIQLGASAAIWGRVTFNGAGVSGVIVATNASCFLCFAITNASGYYRLTNDLATGHYNVSLSSSIVSKLSAHVIASGSAVVMATAGLATRHDFVLSASAVVSGYVKDVHGAGVANATVSIGTEMCFYTFCVLSCHGTFFPCATNMTDATGHYEFNTGLAGGSYNVTAAKGSDKGHLTSLLAVSSGGTVVAPDITMSVTTVTFAHITGTVNDNHGAPVSHALVSGVGGSCSCSNETSTDSSGHFNLEIALTAPDVINVSASANGYVDAFNLVSGVAPGGTYSAGTLTLTIISPATISGTVTGQVISSLIQTQRTQRWVTSGGARVVTRTDSELSVGFIGGVFMFGSTISAFVQGPKGTSGTFTISIPKSLISAASWSVTVDGSPVSASVSSNSTYTVITVSYSHSSHTLEFSPASVTTSSSTHTTSSSSTSTAHSSSSSSSTSSTSSTTTSSHTSTSSSSSTTSTSKSTVAQTSTVPTTSESSSGGGIPEFPPQLGYALLFTAVVMASYLFARRRNAT